MDHLLLTLILLSTGLLILLAFALQWLFKAGGITERKGRLVVLLLAGSGILVLTAALAAWLQYIEWKRWVIAADMLTGAIFLYTYYKLVRPQTGVPLPADILIMLIPVLTGSLWIVYVYYLCMPAPVYWKAAFTLIPFLIPFLFFKAYQALTDIPVGFYFVWYYNNNFRPPAKEVPENAVYVIVEVELSKACTDNYRTKIKAKALPEMCWGEWFQLLISDYNLRYPASPVQCFNEDGKAYGWMFYARHPSSLWRRRVDPCTSLEENHIRGKRRIIARRVAEQEHHIE